MIGFESVGIRVGGKHETAVEPSIADEFKRAHGEGLRRVFW